jgi:hypothetical protein
MQKLPNESSRSQKVMKVCIQQHFNLKPFGTPKKQFTLGVE